MASYTNRGTPSVAMMIVGGVMVVAGAGLMFLGVGAAMRADHQ